MTRMELKAEIQKVLDNVPEAFLEDILIYLKQVQAKSTDTVKLSQNLRKIIDEDSELLKKLAQ
jgi:hypothetical protein